jgi:hypothetical protein
MVLRQRSGGRTDSWTDGGVVDVPARRGGGRTDLGARSGWHGRLRRRRGQKGVRRLELLVGCLAGCRRVSVFPSTVVVPTPAMCVVFSSTLPRAFPHPAPRVVRVVHPRSATDVVLVRVLPSSCWFVRSFVRSFAGSFVGS